METVTSTLQAVAALIDAAAWPAAAGFGVWTLRKELTHLVGRIENVNIAGSSIALARRVALADISDAGEQLAESAEAANIKTVEQPIDQTMRNLIETDGRQAVLLSWGMLQRALVELAERHRVWIDLRSMKTSTDALKEQKIISDELADAVTKLHSTCKYARRVDHFDLPEEEVEEYVLLTQRARGTLDKL